MYFQVKVIHTVLIESKKKGAAPVRRIVSNNYCIQDDILEGALNKANAYFGETLSDYRIKSVSDCVINEYIGNTNKMRMFQVRIHWKTEAENGTIKINTEYILVDGNSISDVEKIVKDKYKDAMQDYEIYSVNGAKIKEVIE